MPSKTATPSRVISRKALLPARFNVSRILLSPRENAELVNFDHFSITPEVPKALRRTSGSLPGTRSETRPDPESSLRINPSFSLRKTTHFRQQTGRGEGDRNTTRKERKEKREKRRRRATRGRKNRSEVQSRRTELKQIESVA